MSRKGGRRLLAVLGLTFVVGVTSAGPVQAQRWPRDPVPAQALDPDVLDALCEAAAAQVEIGKLTMAEALLDVVDPPTPTCVREVRRQAVQRRALAASLVASAKSAPDEAKELLLGLALEADRDNKEVAAELAAISAATVPPSDCDQGRTALDTGNIDEAQGHYATALASSDEATSKCGTAGLAAVTSLRALVTEIAERVETLRGVDPPRAKQLLDLGKSIDPSNTAIAALTVGEEPKDTAETWLRDRLWPTVVDLGTLLVAITVVVVVVNLLARLLGAAYLSVATVPPAAHPRGLGSSPVSRPSLFSPSPSPPSRRTARGSARTRRGGSSSVWSWVSGWGC